MEDELIAEIMKALLDKETLFLEQLHFKLGVELRERDLKELKDVNSKTTNENI